MQRYALFTFILFFLLSANLAGQTTERINFKWLYHRGDIEEAEKIDFDDSDWHIVKLPHDGSLSDTTSVKAGWYRKHIELFGNLNKRKIYIEFEGVLGSYDFWVNNQKLGSQKNGLERVIFDVTPYMQPGENLIALRYEHSEEISNLIDGEGIFSDVWVHFNNLLHIGHHGIDISSSEITTDNAILNIETEIFNHRDISTPCTISVTVADPFGNQVAEAMDSTLIYPEKNFRFENSFRLDKPRLWCFENNGLYKVEIKIADAKGVVDVHEESFPIRKLEFPSKGKVSFTGSEFDLNGLQYHSVYGPLGAAAHHRAVERRLSSLKEMGFNALYLNPQLQSRQIHAWCNENGMLVLNENPDAPDQDEFLDPAGFRIEDAKSGGDAFKVELEPDRKYIAADGFDLCYITAKITDKNGIIVTNARQTVSFKVSGAAEIIGIGNGDRSGNGKVLLILRSNQKKGEIEIKAKAKRLNPALLIVQAI